MNTIENAVIESVFIGREDHGILTMFVHVRGDGWGVGLGGYVLDQYDQTTKKQFGSALLADSVLGLLEVFKVDDIRKLEGKPCRVETEGLGGRAKRIGHYLEDRWFSFQELAEKAKQATS